MARPWLVAAILLAAALAAAADPIDVEVFSRAGCPRCRDAATFLDALTRERPHLRIVTHDVGRDAAARSRLQALAASQGLHPIGVPTFVVGEQVIVGFDAADTTGAEIRAALDRLRPPPVVLPIVGPLDVARLGLPLFTIAVGLVDGFNPCATWVLLFLLSLLVNLHDRRRMLLVAGTFVLVSGAAYLAFMLAWLNAFLLLGLSRPVEVALAAFAVGVGALNLKDAVRPDVGPSVGIPQAAKPTIYARVRRVLQADSTRGALAGAATLAVLVNVVELACTAGLPALYVRILTMSDLSPWQYVGYLLLYDAAYMVDDALMVGVAVATLTRMKLQTRGARVLKALSGAVMLALGLLLLAAPERLGGGLR
jgi:hypothetical protein